MILFSSFLFAVLSVFLATAEKSTKDAGSFYIDFDQNTFVKDFKPFRYVSGSIHPYRVPHELWEDRLDKMWASGLNAIQIYIFWNEHEPYPGVYDFDGQNDIIHFIELAKARGFLIILRPGPYACAEHDYGALPWWLLANGTDTIIPRTIETNYMNAVRRYMSVLLPKFVPYLYKNGGPIITVQVENEYGSYYACDRQYTTALRDLFRQFLGNDVVLFTTDGNSVNYLKCGYIPGVYPTVDFGVDADVRKAFNNQRTVAKIGPLVNSEFYPGWLDWWGSPHAKVATERIVSSFNQIMQMDANVNFYMFFGGTNYGFSNGANTPYLVQPTTYDYDAPISEAGDTNDKYMAIRKAISQYLPIPQVPIPGNSTKIAYGKVQMTYHIPLVDAIVEMSDQCVNTLNPLTFEKLGQGYGFVLYIKKLDDLNVDGKLLSIPKLHDRAYIQIGSASVGVLYRAGQTNLTINLPNNKNDTLYIVVENMGRLNYGDDMLDNKGLIEGVYLGGAKLGNWTTCVTNNFIPNYQQNLQSKPEDNKQFNMRPFVDLVAKYKTKDRLLTEEKLKSIDFKTPAIYIGDFDATDGDTFLRMDKFSKGNAFIRSNDKLTNLGRYWPNTGPQITLYTPSVFMSPDSRNSVILVEFESSSCANPSNCFVEFIDYPLIDSIPSKAKEVSLASLIGKK